MRLFEDALYSSSEVFSIVFPDSLRIRNKILLIQSVRNLHAVLAEFSNFNCPVRLDSHLSVCPCVCRKYQSGTGSRFLGGHENKKSDVISCHQSSSIASCIACFCSAGTSSWRHSAIQCNARTHCPKLSNFNKMSKKIAKVLYRSWMHITASH